MLLFAIVFVVWLCLSFSNLRGHLHETPDLGFEHSLPCRIQLLNQIRLCNANDAYNAGDGNQQMMMFVMLMLNLLSDTCARLVVFRLSARLISHLIKLSTTFPTSLK